MNMLTDHSEHGLMAITNGVRTLVVKWPVSGLALARVLGLGEAGAGQGELAIELTVVPPAARLGAARVVRVSAGVGVGTGGSGGASFQMVKLSNGQIGVGVGDGVEAGDVSAVLVVDDEGLTHVDIAGVVAATWRADGRLLYAATPMFERLGLPGGRVDRPMMEWR